MINYEQAEARAAKSIAEMLAACGCTGVVVQPATELGKLDVTFIVPRSAENIVVNFDDFS